MTPIGEASTGPDGSGSRAPNGGDAAYMAEGRYKLLVGKVRQAGWCGQIHPNNTKWDSFSTVEDCSAQENGKIGCLFDILADPSERHDLALEMPQKAAEIYRKMQAAQHEWFDPDRGEPDQRACEVAKRTGFWQPFLP